VNPSKPNWFEFWAVPQVYRKYCSGKIAWNYLKMSRTT
jgi:hypothetical protein